MNSQNYEHMAANLDDDAGIAVAINSVAARARYIALKANLTLKCCQKARLY